MIVLGKGYDLSISSMSNLNTHSHSHFGNTYSLPYGIEKNT